MIHPLKHFITITKHRHMVMRLCFKAGIGFQGLKHDLSKYSWTEFKTGAIYYKGTFSPNGEERRIKGYSLAWLKHSGKNKHHFEFWVHYDAINGKYEPVLMPVKYVKEMLCDRIAATKVYQKKDYKPVAVLDYYLNRRDCDGMHPKTAELLENWLKLLVSVGEKEMFKKIKKVKEYS